MKTIAKIQHCNGRFDYSCCDGIDKGSCCRAAREASSSRRAALKADRVTGEKKWFKIEFACLYQRASALRVSTRYTRSLHPLPAQKQLQHAPATPNDQQHTDKQTPTDCPKFPTPPSLEFRLEGR